MTERSVTIREYFGLQRPSFMLDPQTDYECYAGRSDEKSLLLDRIQAASDIESAPRLVLWGVYGGGKTHTQFYAGKKLLKEYGNDSVYVICPDLARNATFLDLYKEILMTMGSDQIKDLLQKFLLKVGDAKFKEFFGNPDTANVCLKLVVATKGSEDFIRAWRWLCGEQVTSSEAIGLGATSAITPRDSARFLIKLGEIYNEIMKKRLVLLIDECEKLIDVTDPYAQGTFITAFREISEKLQRHLGFICACTAADYEAIVTPLSSGAVSGRIGEGNYLQISQLKDEELEPFIKDLLGYVVDPKEKEKRIKRLEEKGLTVNEEFYPFTEEAIKLIVTHVAEDPRRKTPRTISDLLNDAATESKKMGKDLVDKEAVANAIKKQERAPRPGEIPRRRRR